MGSLGLDKGMSGYISSQVWGFSLSQYLGMANKPAVDLKKKMNEHEKEVMEILKVRP